MISVLTRTVRPPTMPTRKTKPKADRRASPSIDPAQASYLAAKVMARSGDLPGCECYAGLSDPEFYAEGACAHVLAYVARTAAPPPKSREQAARADLHLLDAELTICRRRIESSEDISDDELDDIEKALEVLEGERRKPAKAAHAVTREAQIAAYGERYDRGEDLWHPGDAWVRQGQRAALERGTDNLDLRVGRVEIAVVDDDGKVRVVERAVVQDETGDLKIIGGGEAGRRLELGGKKKGENTETEQEGAQKKW